MYNPPNVTNPMYGSSVVNGQLVPNYTWSAMKPSQAAAPYWQGNGSKPRTLMGYGMGPTGAAGTGIGGGGGTFPSGDAVDAPWSIRHSPVPWAIAFLVVGILGLRHVHWRGE
jgi:hypothetical protein